MFDTFIQKFEFKGIEIKDQMCEDMTNKEEFLYESHESMEHTMTYLRLGGFFFCGNFFKSFNHSYC